MNQLEALTVLWPWIAGGVPVIVAVSAWASKRFASRSAVKALSDQLGRLEVVVKNHGLELIGVAQQSSEQALRIGQLEKEAAGVSEKLDEHGATLAELSGDVKKALAILEERRGRG